MCLIFLSGCLHAQTGLIGRSSYGDAKTLESMVRMPASEAMGLVQRLEKRQNPAAKADGVAVVTLDVRTNWADGSGFQLLMDADHDTYGVEIPTVTGSMLSAEGDADPAIYAEFENNIPENADGSLSAGAWLEDGEKQSMEIEPGIYDYMLTWMDPVYNRILLLWYGDYAGDDVEFEAGVEYVFTVTQTGWNSRADLRRIYPVDLSVDAILSPETKVDMENEEVSVSISNQGSETISSFTAGYVVDGGQPVAETVDWTLAPGQDTVYTFQARFVPENYGRYTIEAYVETEQEDDVPSNNRRSVSVVNACDLAIEAIVSPVSGAEIGVCDVTVRVANNGKSDVSSCSFGYEFAYGIPVEEVFEGTLPAGESTDYTFAAPVNFYAYDSFHLKAWLGHAFDIDGENDTIEANVENRFAHPHEPLFLCDFDDTEGGLEADWDVIDGNGDGQTWYMAYDEDENGWWWGDGCHAESRAGYAGASDEWMVTKAGIPMRPGRHYVRFNYTGISPYYGEKLRLLYGTSPETEAMTELFVDSGFMRSTAAYYTAVVDLDIVQAGDYYFAFQACSEAGQIGIKLDNVLVDTGRNPSSANLKVDRVLLPLSGCGLAQEAVGARLSNDGAEPVHAFSLSYALNNGQAVTENFTETIPSGRTVEVWFETLADMSDTVSYAVRVEAAMLPEAGQHAEAYLRDNARTESVVHETSLPLPFVTDFKDEADRANWHWRDDAWLIALDYERLMLLDSSWLYTVYPDLDEEPMFSRCMDFTEGTTYRISYEYICGMSSSLGTVAEDFEIRCGIAGTSWEDWTVLREYADHFTMDQTAHDDVSFLCPASGKYSIAIVPITSYNSLLFKSFSVVDAPEHDLRMLDFSIDMPVLMPLSQLGDRSFEASVSVQNQGWSDVDNAQVRIMAGEETLADVELLVGSLGDTAVAKADLRFDSAGIGDDMAIVATVSNPEAEDADMSDNSMERRLAITDSVMAYDEVADSMYTYWHSVGAASENAITCGIPFEIGVADTLTAISIGWAPRVDDEEIAYQVWRWDAGTGTLGELLCEYNALRGVEAGQHEYPVIPMLLKPGSYLLSVTMTGRYLVVDGNLDAPLYMIQGSTAHLQENLGCPAIRAIFGHGAEVFGTDAAATGFTRPAATGSFSPQELVVVKVSNRSVEEKVIPVSLRVNGQMEEPALVKLGAYSSGEVVLMADLSQFNATYEIEAWTALEGDENPANDTCRMTVETVSPADPYKLDFESCSDFSISWLNPQWTMIDGDGHYSYAMDGYVFPYSASPFAFIVFNPEATSPALPESTAHLPFSGSRFGASFSSYEGANDDWLISPKLLLPASGAEASLEVKTYSADYGLEEYNILVSATGNEPEDFVKIGETRTAPSEGWEHVTVDLSDYAGKEIHFAVQCVSDNRFMFMVDDIEISKPTATEALDVASTMSLYPNPAREEVRILSPVHPMLEVEIVDIQGRVVYRSPKMHASHFEYAVEGMRSGVYFARIRTEAGNGLLKFVVE